MQEISERGALSIGKLIEEKTSLVLEKSQKFVGNSENLCQIRAENEGVTNRCEVIALEGMRHW